jgi:hypothetical protein
MSMTPDVAVAVVRPLQVRAVREPHIPDRSPEEMRGALLAIGWDTDRQRGFMAHDHMVLLVLDADGHRLVWVREDEVVEIVPDPGLTAAALVAPPMSAGRGPGPRHTFALEDDLGSEEAET